MNSSINMMAELLVDHQFLDKDLLQEALTHPSCERDTFTESYQRLELLGNAVLDMNVVTAVTIQESGRKMIYFYATKSILKVEGTWHVPCRYNSSF